MEAIIFYHKNNGRASENFYFVKTARVLGGIYTLL